MAFFRNDAINRVNLHSGIQAFAQGAGGIFFLVFLVQAGISIPLALLAQAAIVAGRAIVRPVLLPIARRIGLKPLLICGTVTLALQYPVLASVTGIGWPLLALCIVTSVGEVLYWTSLNGSYASLGDAEHRGHQIGAREALVAVVGIVAPLAGSGLLVAYGARIAFGLVALIQLSAAIPLLGLPAIPVKREAPGALLAARPAILLAALDGWLDTFFIMLWQIALFVSLKQSFAGYGGAMALAGLAGAVCGLVVGRHVDAGHGKRAVIVATTAIAVSVLLRAASIGSPRLAVAANAFGTPALILLSLALSIVPNLAKASPCAFRFAVGTEIGWDAGCFLACLGSAALVAAGVPAGLVMLLALPSVAITARVLRSLYPA
ncbi:MAG: hypothetical protein JOZ55_07855 [Alphaproteobacteria bacterium]|nr:hypothetical protein [Alphaproteobacteria bacterium]